LFSQFRCAVFQAHHPLRITHHVSLKQRINDELKSAMRSGETRLRDTLRLLLAALKQREVDERKELTDADVVAVVERMIKQRREAIAQFDKGGRRDLADSRRRSRTARSRLPWRRRSAQLGRRRPQTWAR